MNKNQYLEFYSTYCWPILRKIVRKSNRCKMCILSDKYTKITNGICSECLLYQKTEHKAIETSAPSSEMTSNFNRLLNSIQVDKKYHLLLMLSGGKDSAYILDRLKIEFPKLKILCLFVNNGFSSTFATKNASHVADKLQADLIVSNDEVPSFYESFRKAFLSLNGQGSSGTVDYADGSKIFQIGNQVAKDFDIPYIIGGLSSTQVKQIIKTDGFIQENPNFPPILFPLAVWRTSEQDIREHVRKKELLIKGSDNPIVSNNDLIITMSAIDVLNNGYCSFEPEFAQMIREGKAERKTWLHNFELLEFATTRGLLNGDIKKTLSKLNLKTKDIVNHKQGA